MRDADLKSAIRVSQYDVSCYDHRERRREEAADGAEVGAQGDSRPNLASKRLPGKANQDRDGEVNLARNNPFNVSRTVTRILAKTATQTFPAAAPHRF